MGEANQRGDFEDRRDQALNRIVEEAEVLLTLKVKDTKAVMSMLCRDDPPDQKSPAVAFAAFLAANWNELMGQALALHSSWLAGASEARPDLRDGVVILNARGMPAGQEQSPMLLGANGRVISSDIEPRIELPASVAQEIADEPVASGGGGDFSGGGAEASFDPVEQDRADQSSGSAGYDTGSSDSGSSDSGPSGD